MALLALSTWSWIGIAALGWVVFSFAFALWVGRLIRVSEQMATAPRQHEVLDHHEERISGVQFRHSASSEIKYGDVAEDRAAGSRYY